MVTISSNVFMGFASAGERWTQGSLILRILKMAKHKYRQIFDKLQEDISSGRYKPGKRLPSEAELVRRFGASRMTVFRAMHELQSLGLVTRRVGSGTYVSSNSKQGAIVFGLLIPELGQTEIFEAICQGMMEAQEAMHHSLLWGNAVSQEQEKEQAAEQLCEHYISRKVSGVFFAPVEFSDNRFQANHRIVAAFDRARIPVVLLDRCLEPYPQRSKYDLVGIDNRRIGLSGHGTPDQSGRETHRLLCTAELCAYGGCPHRGLSRSSHVAIGERHGRDWSGIGDASDTKFIKSILKKDRPDAFVCANDLTAGNLMHTLISLGQRIPEDIRIVGIDDVKYARLLPVPLTTQHQPCRDIGRIAMAVMLDRIANPDLPPRDVLLGCEFMVRQSCGAFTSIESILPSCFSYTRLSRLLRAFGMFT